MIVGRKGGGSGGASTAATLAALGALVGEGNVALFEDDEWTGLPLVEGVPATAWDLLTGQADGLEDQGAALKAWQDSRGAGSAIASGVCTFLWPADADGQRNRTGYQRWVVGSSDDDSGSVYVAVDERATEILAVDQVLTIACEIENDTGSALTVELAAPGSGIETVEWAEGNADVELADGETAVVYVNCYPDRCLALVEIVSA